MKLLNKKPSPQIPLTLEQIEADLLTRPGYFYQFYKEAWKVLQEGVEYSENWHIPLLCQTLEATTGQDKNIKQIRQLMINIPPRCGKTLLLLTFVCWMLAKDSSKKFMFVTSTDDLVGGNSRLIKKLLTSSWFQKRWPTEIPIMQANNIVTKKGGYFKGYAITSAITGSGCDYLLLDDLLDVTGARSQAELDGVNQIYDETLVSRLNSQKRGVKILIMQRLSTGDLCQHLIDRENSDWEKVIIPLEYTGVRFVSSLGLKDPRTEIGELFWESRFGPDEVRRLQLQQGKRAYSAQYLQYPTPVGGNLIDRSWFNERVEGIPAIATYISVDTASSVKNANAYTAFVVGELLEDYRLRISYVYRERLTLPQQIKTLKDLSIKYAGNLRKIIIEGKSTCDSIFQSIESQADDELYAYLTSYNPTTEKEARCAQASIWMENGSVVFPPETPEYNSWLFPYQEEIFNFPNVKFLDQTDATDQLIIWLENILEDGFRQRNNL